ncbi:MAG: DEAD/DEAH box helicase, partial [Bryobacteraceae bacterium]
WDAVIVDEAHHIKNASAQQTRAVVEVSQHSRFRWALTGTPIQNSMDDLRTIFSFVDPSLLPHSVAQLSIGAVRTKIAPYFLRREKKDVFPELPAKIRSEEWLELDDSQRAEYERLLGRERERFRSGEKEFTKLHVFALLNKLKQVCNFAPNSTKGPKSEAMQEKLEEILSNRKKVLVFSQYKEQGVAKLEGLLRQYGVITVTGETPKRDLEDAVKEFQRSDGRRIFLATVRTAGEALTLTAASYVIHFDHWWNPAVAWQAEDRAHRHGQTESVNIYSYWMKDTVEERIHGILGRKGLLHEQIVGALSEFQIDRALSIDDLLEILDLDRSSVSIPKPKDGSEEDRTPALASIYVQLQRADPASFVMTVTSVFREILGYKNARNVDGPGDGGVDIEASKGVESLRCA